MCNSFFFFFLAFKKKKMSDLFLNDQSDFDHLTDIWNEQDPMDFEKDFEDWENTTPPGGTEEEPKTIATRSFLTEDVSAFLPIPFDDDDDDDEGHGVMSVTNTSTNLRTRTSNTRGSNDVHPIERNPAEDNNTRYDTPILSIAQETGNEEMEGTRRSNTSTNTSHLPTRINTAHEPLAVRSNTTAPLSPPPSPVIIPDISAVLSETELNSLLSISSENNSSAVAHANRLEQIRFNSEINQLREKVKEIRHLQWEVKLIDTLTDLLEGITSSHGEGVTGDVSRIHSLVNALEWIRNKI